MATPACPEADIFENQRCMDLRTGSEVTVIEFIPDAEGWKVFDKGEDQFRIRAASELRPMSEVAKQAETARVAASNGNVSSAVIPVIDSNLRFKVQGGDYDGQTFAIDALLLEVLLDEVQRDHPETEMSPEDAEREMKRLQRDYDPTKRYYRRSSKFLLDLSNRVAEIVGFCTPTIADKLWSEFQGYVDTQKKSTDDMPSSPPSLDQASSPTISDETPPE